jgi:oxygen-dependent protoporphyrinogen oxidase
VYAGKPEDLSVKSAFPKLYALEENYGGLIIGTIKSIRERRRRAEKSKQSAKMISFKDGMKVLPEAITKHLGQKVIFNSNVKSISKSVNDYTINYENEGSQKSISCNAIVSTVPSYVASEIFSGWDEILVKHLNEIYYPPVLVLYLGYTRSSIKRPLDGFGFLIPSKEKKSFLGAIWSSVIFPNRSSNSTAAFTLFVGGARNPEIGNTDRDILIKRIRKEFELLMKINAEPVYTSTRFWERAIPQYNIGYIEHENYFDEFEKRNPGIILSGNYRGGISVGDCIKNAELVVEKAMGLI